MPCLKLGVCVRAMCVPAAEAPQDECTCEVFRRALVLFSELNLFLLEIQISAPPSLRSSPRSLLRRAPPFPAPTGGRVLPKYLPLRGICCGNLVLGLGLFKVKVNTYSPDYI